MKLIAMCLFVTALVFSVSLLDAASPRTPWGTVRTQVMVQVVVSVPSETQANATIFLAGSGTALGDWKVDGLALKRQSDGSWRGQFQARVGEVIECKVNQGSWDKVEKADNGAEVKNRRFVVEKDQAIEIKVARWSGSPNQENSSLTGNIQKHAGFASRILKNSRDLLVYLPPAYDENKNIRYPVFYLHDGQNLFDCSTGFMGNEWNVDETAERLIKSGKLQPVILVGVANTVARNDEYTPVYSEEHKFGGKGELYSRFLVEEVKPFIDQTYRTRPGRESTAVGGSSLGGLISLYLCSRYPKVFSKCAALSPSLWWEKTWLLNDLAGNIETLSNTHLWSDMGTREGDGPESAAKHLANLRRLGELLKKAGLKEGSDFVANEIEGGTHNEQAWSARFDKVLLFLFPARAR